MDQLLDAILAFQSPGGAFASTVSFDRFSGEDLNCFTTALVVRELTSFSRLTDIGKRADLEDANRRAIGYLLRSHASGSRCTFAFYPPDQHPFWIGDRLPADADDSSVVALELFRAGKLTDQQLRDLAKRYLIPFRAAMTAHTASKPWHCDGAFLTWLDAEHDPNPIDCCVNANVLALLAATGLSDHPSYRAAISLIETAVSWAGNHPARLREITPFYPDPREFAYALRHAVDWGATELRKPAHALEKAIESLPEPRGPRRFYSNLAGTVFWEAPVIELARRLSETVDNDRRALCLE